MRLGEIVVVRAEADDVFCAIIPSRPAGFHVVWVDNSMDAAPIRVLPAVQAGAVPS
jgi:hypothetical protein